MIVSAPVLRSVSEVGLWLAGRRSRVRVVGESMEPTLEHGEFVLVDPRAAASIGDLVTATHPEDETIVVVKRIAERGDDSYHLASDNPAGADSRSWGPVPASSVLGRVTIVLDRPLADLNADPAAGPPTAPHWSRWLRR